MVIVKIRDLETIMSSIVTAEEREDEVLGVLWLQEQNILVKPAEWRIHFGAKEWRTLYNVHRAFVSDLSPISLDESNHQIPPQNQVTF
ncbi:hypothetical protein PR048_013887 [Dryococelus australis]|uniref:Uncharacterized protein n=1 Tax=Dryococelus australis TaxID=614101 RepID=A0ABQ9HTG1_9NEOP|nr:hypothetical protein PR048_013887 [Dryococelus australis]